MPNQELQLPAQIEGLAQRLQLHTPRRLGVQHSGRAAVLMPLLPLGEDFCFLLTQRTYKVETHKGQISFPGGLQEESDRDLLHTALRETWEEIGLPAECVQVLGEFDEYLSINGLIVRPFAGWVGTPLDLEPNPDEVDEILRVPFKIFQDSRYLRIETQLRRGVEKEIYFYHFQGKEVWGLTAQIIRDFMRLVEDPAQAKCV
ncbi:MAG: CoA pyrophosphatase [Acidimicrobiia bacterium]|nr:CoA pyrophosphatase [Acidimicrobiia bacterium]